MIPLVGDRQRIYEQTLESMEVTISSLYIFIFNYGKKLMCSLTLCLLVATCITAASFANKTS